MRVAGLLQLSRVETRGIKLSYSTLGQYVPGGWVKGTKLMEQPDKLQPAHKHRGSLVDGEHKVRVEYSFATDRLASTRCALCAELKLQKEDATRQIFVRCGGLLTWPTESSSDRQFHVSELEIIPSADVDKRRAYYQLCQQRALLAYEPRTFAAVMQGAQSSAAPSSPFPGSSSSATATRSMEDDDPDIRDIKSEDGRRVYRLLKQHATDHPDGMSVEMVAERLTAPHNDASMVAQQIAYLTELGIVYTTSTDENPLYQTL